MTENTRATQLLKMVKESTESLDASLNALPADLDLQFSKVIDEITPMLTQLKPDARDYFTYIDVCEILIRKPCCRHLMIRKQIVRTLIKMTQENLHVKILTLICILLCMHENRELFLHEFNCGFILLLWAQDPRIEIRDTSVFIILQMSRNEEFQSRFGKMPGMFRFLISQLSSENPKVVIFSTTAMQFFSNRIDHQHLFVKEKAIPPLRTLLETSSDRDVVYQIVTCLTSIGMLYENSCKISNRKFLENLPRLMDVFRDDIEVIAKCGKLFRNLFVHDDNVRTPLVITLAQKAFLKYDFSPMLGSYFEIVCMSMAVKTKMPYFANITPELVRRMVKFVASEFCEIRIRGRFLRTFYYTSAIMPTTFFDMFVDETEYESALQNVIFNQWSLFTHDNILEECLLDAFIALSQHHWTRIFSQNVQLRVTLVHALCARQEQRMSVICKKAMKLMMILSEKKELHTFLIEAGVKDTCVTFRNLTTEEETRNYAVQALQNL